MPATSTIVFENGTMLGSISYEQRNLPSATTFVIPEIVISASRSSNSLHRSRNDIESEETAAESTHLLEYQQQQQQAEVEAEDNEFEQFISNRTTSESNMLDSSIYSELQLSINATPTTTTTHNSSACSRSDSRQSKRTRRKSHNKAKSKCSSNNNVAAAAGSSVSPPVANYPPQYTAIFLDHSHHHLPTAAVNGMANVAAASPFVHAEQRATNLIQYQQYYQQHTMGITQPFTGYQNLHHARRTLLDVALPLASGSADCASNLAGTNVNISAAGTANSALSTELGASPLSYNFRKWFARPSLPFVIGIFALGGVACTLGGIVLGSTGLIEHSTQYLSAALLMIGIGVSLLVISGAIWRLTLPDDVDDCPCFRRMETCRNCNSPHCTNRLMPGHFLHPEFQHRPPPPSYLTSLNEFAFVYHHSAHPQAAYAAVRIDTPPPLYRSTYSLNTPATHLLPGAVSLLPTSEQPAVLYTREATSQTSFKEMEIDEIREAPLAIPLNRETDNRTLFKEVELD